MTERVPPPWDNDPLSAFLATAQSNERVSSLKLPHAYALLQRTYSAFERVSLITERENTPTLVSVRILMARVRGAWLAAVRMSLGGQTVEAYPLVRTVIEAAWYALYIARDPAPPARATVWLCRDDDDAAESLCRSEFAIANVRGTHERLDAGAAGACYALYRQTIELGAHPNERGALTALRRSEDGFEAVLLTDDWRPIALALKNALEAAVCALKVFTLIFPERFAIMSVSGDIERLMSEVNTLFAEYAAAARTTSTN